MKDCWLVVPHLADDDYMRQLATLAKNTLNPNLKLTEMIVFGLRSGDVKVGVTLMNIRRMRAKVNKQYDNESNVIDEKVYGLDLFIAEVVKPYKPTSK
jgi:hypothetical protein